MELKDFLRQIQSEVRSAIAEEGTVFSENAFTEIVMQHMAENSFTFDTPEVCHFDRKVGNAKLRLSGYAISDDTSQVDLFVSLYFGTNELSFISDAETLIAAERCVRFL